MENTFYESSDTRVNWIQDRICHAFDLDDPAVLHEFLTRDDGSEERRLKTFLDETSDENILLAIFYRIDREEEEEIEVEYGKFVAHTTQIEKQTTYFSHSLHNFTITIFI